MLIKALRQKKWSFKADIYTPVFESALVHRPVHKPVISIVIISWRFIPGLEKNLSTLRRQHPGNPEDDIEIILVDNGSTPGGFQSLMKYVNSYVRLNRNTGAYLARNMGALFSSAPVLLFLDDDAVPHDHLIAAHLYAHRAYSVSAVQGAVLPKTNNPLNAIPVCYYLGDKPFPTFSDIEGNTSYNAGVFFEAGGWDDAIVFGGGGVDLALRILEIENDPARQMYAPYAVIYHDHARNLQHKQNKLEKQLKSRLYLREKHPAYDELLNRWLPFYGKKDQLIPNPKGNIKPPRFVEQDLFMDMYEKEMTALNGTNAGQHIFHVSFFLENILRIGNKFRLRGQFEESRRWFEKVLRYRNRHIVEFRARAYYYLGELNEQLSPGSGTPYWKKAIFSLRSKSGKTDSDIYHMASLYKRLRQWKSAKKWFRRLINDHSTDEMKAGACFHLGEICWLEKNIESARTYFESCLNLNPGHRKADEYLTALDENE